MFADQTAERNRTAREYPCDQTIADQFEQQAERTPQRLALISGADAFTYEALNQAATAFALRLTALGAGPETLVGVCLHRHAQLLVAMLGILKAGAAYVPIDPDYPQERQSLVINDAKLHLLVTDTATGNALAAAHKGLHTLNTDETLPAATQNAPGALAARTLPEARTESITPAGQRASGTNLAYVLYTSGSTGRPKGVMVEHRNVANFFVAMDDLLGSDPGVWLAVTSISFDISVLELFWTLTRGYTVVLHGNNGPRALADEITRHAVTHLQMTPSLARMITLDRDARASLACLKTMLLGGEALPPALVQELRTVFDGQLFNMYGPTETTIWSTCAALAAAPEKITIGKPIANTQIHLLNDALAPVADGEAGELCIGGAGVARGYWQREQLTGERFLTLPQLSPGRVYRTGDLARWLADGSLEFLGRTDDQVKLRGHRIELGEIEAALEQLDAVRQAVVVLREDRAGDQRLVAYLVSGSDSELEQSQSAGRLHIKLAAQLPEAMIPSAFVFLPTLPLTNNGKIDRKALRNLPPPGACLNKADRSNTAADSGTASALELMVADAWKQALQLAHVGLDENFFDLGAHSLSTAEVHALLQEKLGRSIELVDLFEYSTVRLLAAHLGGNAASNAATDRAARRRMARQER